MRLHILLNVQDLTFEGAPATDLAIGCDLRLTTNPQIPATLLDDLFASAFGKAHIQASKGCAAHLCVLNKYPQPSLSHEEASDITRVSIDRTLVFLQALWLIKDNSGNVGAALVASVGDDGYAHYIYQPHSVINTTSGCLHTLTHFTLEEVAAAVSYFARMLDIMPAGVHRKDQPRPTGMIFATRLGRALYVTQAARSTADLGIKVAFYCIAFESLFSTDTSGVGHRVAERMAHFLGDDGPDRRSVYKDVQALYATRSKVVHGDTIKASAVPELLDLTKRGDEYLRQCLRRMIDNPKLTSLFSKNDRIALVAYFVQALFPDQGRG